MNYELCIMNCALFYKNCTIDYAKCLYLQKNKSYERFI